MKYQWRISGKKFVLDDRSEEYCSVTEHKIVTRPGGWVLFEKVLADGRVERVRGIAVQRGSKLSAQWRSSEKFSGAFFGDWTRLQTGVISGSSGISASDFTSQFPGKVRKILVKEGELVAENQKLLLVEAMKMEFSIQAPCPGTVKKVLVTEGQQLSPGVLMIDFGVSEDEK